MNTEAKPKVIKAEQQYDLRGIFGTLGNYLNPSLATAEFIDNAIDTLLPNGEKMTFLVDFYPHEQRVVLVNEGTVGMPSDQMQEYVRFGRFDRIHEISQQKMHGFGGKMAALWWLNEGQSSFSLLSTPPDSDITYEMTIADWHNSLLKKDVEWDIHETGTEIPMPNGYTRMILENVDETRITKTKPQLINVAEYLGLTYGKYIETGLLDIKLRLIRRGTAEINVQPKTIRFKEGAKTHKTQAPMTC